MSLLLLICKYTKFHRFPISLGRSVILFSDISSPASQLRFPISGGMTPDKLFLCKSILYTFPVPDPGDTVIPYQFSARVPLNRLVLCVQFGPSVLL